MQANNNAAQTPMPIDDSDIILRSRDNVESCVSKVLLSLQSESFRAMFSISQPSTESNGGQQNQDYKGELQRYSNSRRSRSRRSSTRCMAKRSESSERECRINTHNASPRSKVKLVGTTTTRTWLQWSLCCFLKRA